MTHKDLVELAAAWLHRNHVVVITEMAHGAGEEPDAIGFTGYGKSTLVECKASRSDFLADRKKWFRQQPHHGLGRLRYMLAPDGVIAVEELPTGWGLLKPTGRGVRAVAHGRPFDVYGQAWELQLRVSALRRTDGLCVRRYTYETKSRATIGCAEYAASGGAGDANPPESPDSSTDRKDEA